MKRFTFLTLAAATALLASCGDKNKEGSSSSGGSNKATLKVSGSNTMVQISQAWGEKFGEDSGVKVSVSGPGSGIGITALIEGQIDICTSSRPLKDKERADIKAKHGKDAVEFHVGYDALAVYVNPANPVTQISLEQLKDVYIENGAVTTWEQLGAGTGPIEVLGRESGSGTYDYIHDVVLGKAKFRTTVAAQTSSQAIIDNVGNMKGAIAYDGMGYRTDRVKWIAVSKKTGEPGVLPSIDDARSGNYPLARKLYLYTVGEPTGHAKALIDLALSDAGQKLLADAKYVSLK